MLGRFIYMLRELVGFVLIFAFIAFSPILAIFWFFTGKNIAQKIFDAILDFNKSEN